MTPQERKLIDELFDRLASLESESRDPDAVDAINEGLERAPNALYPLVQTALVQDEALRRAEARIRELEQELGIEQPRAPEQGSFLDNMRDALLGRREQQGSVPTVRQGAPGMPGSPWRNTAGRQDSYAAEPMRYPEQAQPGGPFSGGGSFLGTAAATAAGVVGGALLMNTFRSMFGGQGQSHSAFDAGGGSGTPWTQSQGGSDLARDAGLNDIGSGRTAAYDDPGRQDRAGLFDVAQNDDGDSDFDNDGDDFDFGDDSDTA